MNATPLPLPSPCTLDGCDGTYHARGFCQRHYNAWKTYGDPLATAPVKPKSPCSAAGCANLSRYWGLCNGHASRMKAHGDVMAGVPLQIKGRRRTQVCSIEGCTEPFRARDLCAKHYMEARAAALAGKPCVIAGCSRPRCSATRGWCEAHYQHWREYGDPLAGPALRQPRSPNYRPSAMSAEYRLNHRCVRAARGPAWQQTCEHCGKQARDWATIHGCTGESPDDFMPLCKSCHQIYDGVRLPVISRGEACASAKLTEEIVRLIRIRHAAGESARVMAGDYGVIPDSIRNVVNFRTWRHVA